jgi:hypothetical protein
LRTGQPVPAEVLEVEHADVTVLAVTAEGGNATSVIKGDVVSGVHVAVPEGFGCRYMPEARYAMPAGCRVIERICGPAHGIRRDLTHGCSCTPSTVSSVSRISTGSPAIVRSTSASVGSSEWN